MISLDIPCRRFCLKCQRLSDAREAVKISALTSGKNDNYKYLTDEEILRTDQRIMTKQTKFTYLPLGSAFEKQIKIVEDKGKKKLIKAVEDHGKQLVESNQLIDKDLISTEIVYYLKNKINI